MKKLAIFIIFFSSVWLQPLYCMHKSEDASSESSENVEYYDLKGDYHELKVEYHNLKSEFYKLKKELLDLKKELRKIKNKLHIKDKPLKKDPIAEELWIKDYYEGDDMDVNHLPKERIAVKNFDNRLCYFELLPGYFYPTDKRLRDIYDNGGFNGQAEIGAFALDWLGVWLKGGAFWKSAKTKMLQDSTRIVIANVSAGVKFFRPITNRLQFYAGIGPRVFFLRVKNGSTFVDQKVSKTNLGAAAVAGFWLFPIDNSPLFFDLFVDYSFSYMKFSSSQSSERNNLDLSGPTIGAGLGYQF